LPEDNYLEIRLLDLSGRQHGRAQAIDIKDKQKSISNISMQSSEMVYIYYK
jgi:hypothetical protein